MSRHLFFNRLSQGVFLLFVSLVLVIPITLTADPPASLTTEFPPPIMVLPPFEPTPLNANQQKEALAYLQQDGPLRMESLTTMRRNDPDLFQLTLNRALREKRELERLRISDPARYERKIKERVLVRRSWELAWGMGQKMISESDRQILTRELTRIIGELFDLREETRLLQIQRLENQLAELRRLSTIRQSHRNDIIRKRLEEMLIAKEFLEW